MIGILDLDVGNIRSVSNAVHSLGFEAVVVNAPAQLDDVTHLVLPGVGAFPIAMRALHTRGLASNIAPFVASGRPVLGICLGMHLLADFGEEDAVTEPAAGLGLVPGTVSRLVVPEGLAIPHSGWNSVHFERAHPLLARVKDERDFYFVHSYRFACANATDQWGTTDYGSAFPSIVGRNNVVGFQFHPEKSQANGLRLLENFCAWDGTC